MAKIEIGSWEIAEKFGLCFMGAKDTTDKWGDSAWHMVYDFHGGEIKIREDGYSYPNQEDYHEKAAEIVLLSIGRAVAQGLTMKVD